MLGLRARAGSARQAPEGEVAQRALITLADELEHARALRDVVVRLRQAFCGAVQRPAEPKEFAHAPGMARASMRRGHTGDSLLGLSAPSREQRFAGDESA